MYEFKNAFHWIFVEKLNGLLLHLSSAVNTKREHEYGRKLIPFQFVTRVRVAKRETNEIVTEKPSNLKTWTNSSFQKCDKTNSASRTEISPYYESHIVAFNATFQNKEKK